MRTPEEVELHQRAERARAREYRRRRAQERAAARAAAAAAAAAQPDPVSAADAALIERYLQARRTRLLQATITAYRADLRAFAAAVGDLCAVREEDVARYLHERTRDPKQRAGDVRPWTRRTARRKRAALAGFYRWALRAGEVAANPAEAVEIARAFVDAPVRIAPIHWDQLVAHVEFRIAAGEPAQHALALLDLLLLRLLYNFGLRVSEAVGIQIPDLRREGEELRVKLVKKGDKTRWYPLVGHVLEAYERWMRLRPELRARPGHEDYLLLYPPSGQRVSRQRAWKRLRQLAAEAGLPREIARTFSPHKLRHAIAYHRTERGDPLPAVQALLDHESLDTTGIYVRPDERARLAVLRQAAREG